MVSNKDIFYNQSYSPQWDFQFYSFCPSLVGCFFCVPTTSEPLTRNSKSLQTEVRHSAIHPCKVVLQMRRTKNARGSLWSMAGQTWNRSLRSSEKDARVCLVEETENTHPWHTSDISLKWHHVSKTKCISLGYKSLFLQRFVNKRWQQAQEFQINMWIKNIAIK